ncbi:hypothetical protein H9660_14625 [Clostridium sp. Sa3CUN1]|uniref:Uncharacterized protein n=1 Tax=Clostridium gallinarum TaxID=2762246 RepID=A0ABR8Q7K2_9CLOT|nr:hypothetical protein [Clostridium gallinarum]MBD7916379.1 hypothetical protein [Clostridium gallinarum]
MKRLNNIYIAIFFLVILLSLFIGYFTRKSIYDLDISNIDKSKYSIEYSLDIYGSNLKNPINNINLVDQNSDLIIKGEFTGNRKIIYGSVESEIKVLSVYKGNIKDKYIYLYEPFNIIDFKNPNQTSNEIKGNISLTNGYNLLKPNHHNILLLNNITDPSTNEVSKKYLNKYKYNNISLSKFSIDDDINYVIFDESTTTTTFDDIKDKDWIFSNKEDLANYLLAKNIILDKYNK